MQATISKQARATALVLLAVVVLGYGVPLARGWVLARRDAETERTRALIEREAEACEAAFLYQHWAGLLVARFHDERTRDFLLRRRDHPRTLMRFIVAEQLWRSFPDDPIAHEVMRDYVLNPRENFSLRNKMLDRNPDLKAAQAGREALALIEAQRGFFPNREGIRVYY